jgi:hypothetical protein
MVMETDTQNQAAEMESFYREYVDSFNEALESGDLVAPSRYFAYPHIILFTSEMGGMRIINDAREYASTLRKGQVALKARGWARTRVEAIAVWPTTVDTGLIVQRYARCRSDGSVIERGGQCYILRREGEQWRIAVSLEALSKDREQFRTFIKALAGVADA